MDAPRRDIGWPRSSRFRSVSALLLAAALIVAGSWMWRRGRPERHLAEAGRLLDEGLPGEASGWLALPVATPATRDRALLLTARAAVLEGRPADAVSPLRQLDPDGPLGADVAFWRGRALYAAGQVLQASRWFGRSRASRPDDPETLRWVAASAYDLGSRSTATSALGEITRLRPDDARAWRSLALIFHENLRHREALEAYQASLRLDPNQPRARIELAEDLMALGRHEEAERQLAAARGGVPEAERIDLLIPCLSNRGDQEGLEKALDAGLAASPDHPGLNLRRSQLDLVEGRFDQALGRLDRVLAADPYNAQAYYQRSLALGRLGRGEEAGRDRDQIQELNRDLAEMSALNDEADRRPEDPDVRYRIAALCERLGKWDLAATWYSAALACDPGHAGARAALQALKRAGGRAPASRSQPGRRTAGDVRPA